ncbi:MAG: CPBP family intramembrane glutamic endopeptidase [Pseudomonadota bacterium]
MAERQRIQAIIDITLIIGAAAGVQALVHPFAWQYASLPAAFCVILLSTFLIRKRGWRWVDFGLRGPSSFRGVLITLGQAALTLISVMVIAAIVAVSLDAVLERPEDPLARFDGIQGDWRVYLMWLALGWIVGGFIEEMVFRGFLINRVETLLTGVAPVVKTTMLSGLAIIVPAALFGLAHVYYRGLHGALVVTAVGITFGAFYLMFGRRLWPLILAHGGIDTIVLTAYYLGVE